MYKVYYKMYNGWGKLQVQEESRTTTPSPSAAKAAFLDLIKNEEHVGKKVHAVLSLDNRQLMYHRFDKAPGHKDFVELDAEIKLFHGE